MKNKNQLYIVFSIIWILIRCANPKPLTGGKKDEVAPKLVKTFPIPNSINFNGKKIIFLFDELIRDNGIKQKIIITPTIQGDFNPKVLKNKVEITFVENFKPNTTYTINLTECIKDVTEGNITKTASICFSTGSFIDSIYIAGKITHLYTSQPIKDCLIGIYASDDTITFFNGKPLYVTRSDENGKWKINNIKKGSYLIYALNDANANLKFDAKEAAGFKKDTIFLSKHINDINIPIQRYDTRDLSVLSKSYDQEKDNYKIELSKTIQTLSITPTNKSDTIYYTILDSKKNIELYSDKRNDSIYVQLIGIDSFNTTINKTVSIFIPTQKEKDKEKNKTKKTNPLTINLLNPSLNAITDSLVIVMNKPIKYLFLEKMYFKKDSIDTMKINPSEIKWDETKTKLYIYKKLENKIEKINLILEKGCMFSIQKDTCDSTGYPISFKKVEDYGTIGGKIISKKYTQYWIQLLTDSKNIYKEIKNKSEFKFESVEPATYTLRILIDENKDGKWEIGNLMRKIESEKLIIYDKKIEVKANWDVEDINVSVDK